MADLMINAYLGKKSPPTRNIISAIITILIANTKLSIKYSRKIKINTSIYVSTITLIDIIE